MFKESGVKMDYKMIKTDSYNLHLIKTNRYKEIEVHLYLSNKFDKDTYYKRNLMIDLLTENNALFPKRRDKSLFLEDLYGANLYSSISRDGNYHNCELLITFLDPRYLQDEILEPSIKFLFDSLFNPYFKDGLFDNEIFEQRRNYFMQQTKSYNEYPRNKALLHAKELIDESTPIGYFKYGTLEQLANVTNEEIVNEYKKMIKDDIVDIFIVGNIDEQEITKLVSKYAKFTKRNNTYGDVFVYPKVKDKVTIKSEQEDVSQSVLINEYNTVDLTPFEYKYVMHVFCEILGGGSLETKLYRRVRNENSLCYSILSSYDKYDNVLYIYTGVDKKNIKKAQKIIDKTLLEMKDNITDEELSNAINNIVNDIVLEFNSISIMPSFYYYSYIGDLDPLEKRLETYRSITKEDVYKLYDKLKLNTIYTMEGSDTHEED